MTYETNLFINGQFVPALSKKTFQFIGAAGAAPLAIVQEAGAQDVELAVAAAEASWPAWSNKSAYDRAQCLQKWGALIVEHASELAQLDALSMGKPPSLATFEMYDCKSALDHFAALTMFAHGESSLNTTGMVNVVIKQPYGVVAGIIPWNFTAMMFVWKVGPAIGAGNSIIMKTSEKSPLVPLYLARLSKEAGIPDGVISVLNGGGLPGRLLSEHMRIRKIAFTGSTRTGRAIQRAAADSNLKNVTLELGGKSPVIIFADADIKLAAEAAALGITFNSGQVCAAGSRVYIQKSIEAEFLPIFKAAITSVISGKLSALDTNIGAMADAIQGKAVTDYIEVGKSEATLLLGGGRISSAEGWAIEPTVFTNVPDDSRINREEVFGPVLVLHTFETEEEVLRRANDSEYGLFSAVFTSNFDRAWRMAKGIEAGSVCINCSTPTAAADMPFGGYKTSGIGREKGINAISNWLETKTVYCKLG